MKKTLALIAMSALAVIAANADGPAGFRITGQLQTGLQDVVTISGYTAVDALSLYDNDTGNPSRFRIGLFFTSPDENWGLTARLDNEVLRSSPYVSPVWNQALVWGNLFERLVTVKAGLLDEQAFSFTWKTWGRENIWGDDFDGSLGAEIQVRPMPGLQVGWVLPIIQGTGIYDSIQSSYSAVSLAAPGMLKAVAGIQLSPAYSTAAWIGVDLLAVSDLTARFAAQALNIGDSYNAWLELYQEAGYPFLGIRAALKAWEEIYSVPNSSIAWQAEPSISYPFGGSFTLTVLADVGTLLASDPNPGRSSLPFGIGGGAAVAYAPVPSSTVTFGALYKVPDVSVGNSVLQIFIGFQWYF